MCVFRDVIDRQKRGRKISLLFVRLGRELSEYKIAQSFSPPQDEDKLNELRSGSSSLPAARVVWMCVEALAQRLWVVKSIRRPPFTLRVSLSGLTSSSRLNSLYFRYGNKNPTRPITVAIIFRTMAAEGKLANNVLFPRSLSDDRSTRRTNPS